MLHDNVDYDDYKNDDDDVDNNGGNDDNDYVCQTIIEFSKQCLSNSVQFDYPLSMSLISSVYISIQHWKTFLIFLDFLLLCFVL